MLRRNFGFILLFVAFSFTATSAQDTAPSTPAHPESAAVLKALSIPVSRDLKQKITFATDKLNIRGNWAFVSGQARNADGGEPNWKITKHQPLIESNDFEDNLYGLLKKTNGKWRVVTYMMNCHDVCYLDWARRYKAPKAIIE